MKKALRRVKEEGPDIVLTDVALPGMSGVETSRVIRRTHTGGGRIPVVLMSGGGVTDGDLLDAQTES